MPENQDHPRHCSPHRRCGLWRTCPRCAGVRQARVADAAERLAAYAGSIDWTTLEPISPGADALRAVRAAWIEAAKPAGAIWTVERSPRSGRLHCNILTPPGPPPWLPSAYQHRIVGVDDPRAVAAYISKRAQLPERRDYAGRLWGTAGPLWQFLTSGEAFPTVQAAAVQADIDRAAPRPVPASLPPRVAQVADLSTAEYRAILARRLPAIVAAAGPPPPRWRPGDTSPCAV